MREIGVFRNKIYSPAVRATQCRCPSPRGSLRPPEAQALKIQIYRFIYFFVSFKYAGNEFTRGVLRPGVDDVVALSARVARRGEAGLVKHVHILGFPTKNMAKMSFIF